MLVFSLLATAVILYQALVSRFIIANVFEKSSRTQCGFSKAGR